MIKVSHRLSGRFDHGDRPANFVFDTYFDSAWPRAFTANIEDISPLINQAHCLFYGKFQRVILPTIRKTIRCDI